MSTGTTFVLLVFGIVGVAALWRLPVLSVYLTIAASGFGLLAVLLNVDSGLLSTAVFAVAAVGAMFTIAKGRSTSFTTPAIFLTAALLVGAGLAFAVARDMPIGQALQGCRLVAVPLFCAITGLGAKPGQLSWLLRFATIVVVVSTAAALYETAVGAERLIAAGLTYGQEVRTYEGTFRAPGLFTRNYEFGAFAGALAGFAVAAWPRRQSGRPDSLWRVLALVSSLVGLVLAFYRGGFLIFFIALALTLIVDPRPRFGRKAVAAVAAVGVGGYLVVNGFASSDSLVARGAQWAQIQVSYPINALGYGIGFSGSASNSRLSARSITVDNYYLDFALQFGLIGALIFFLGLLAILIYVLSTVRGTPSRMAAVVPLACFGAFAIVDLWEYTGTMAFVLAVTAASLNRSPVNADGDGSGLAPDTGVVDEADHRVRGGSHVRL